jgi:hypothetical protein
MIVLYSETDGENKMAKRSEAPTIKQDVNRVRDNEVTYTHPAYGVIGISNISTGNYTLFGSNVKHSHFVSLRIKTAERHTDGNHDFIFGKQELIEVYLSPTQFAEMLTTSNCGDGVPCTISRRETNRDIPYIESQDTVITDSRKALQDRLDKITVRAKEMITKSEAMLESKKPLTKADMKELNGYLYTIKQELNSNLSYVAKCFDEKMETTIAHAKGEVESFVSSTITRAGLDAIANGTYAPQLELKGKADENI